MANKGLNISLVKISTITKNVKIDKFLFSIIIFILLLGLVTFWQFNNSRRALSEVKLPSFEMPKVEIPLFPEGEKKKEFISPDGKLKLEHHSDWMETPKESLENLNEEPIKEGGVLFLAQKFKLEKTAFAILIVQELEKKENIEELIEGFKNATKEKGGEIEIISLNIKENDGYFEAKYKREDSIFRSKEKIIFRGDKFYLISIFALEKDWSEFESEANEILGSAQLIL